MKLFLSIFLFLATLSFNANAYITESSLLKAVKKESTTPAKAYELRTAEEKNNIMTKEVTISSQAQDFHNSFKKNIAKSKPSKSRKSGNGGGMPTIGSGMFVK